MKNEFRHLPSVDQILSDKRILELHSAGPRSLVTDVVRQVLEDGREAIARGDAAPSLDSLVASASARVRTLSEPSLKPLINATGVILHTNLGRAPLSTDAVAAMQAVSQGYTNLEFDLGTGARGHRDAHLVSLLRQLTGAEDALVVNNNASAVLLALTGLCRRKEVIVSRGQAVEIGGGFRIPDVMRQSGAKLVEVGTTNCTYISDYEQAITSRTASLLRVHSSNFKVVGFGRETGIAELTELGRKAGIPVLDDLGSGCLVDTTRYGLAAEPMVQASVAAGSAIVMFSGDKLLGGPQAGIIVGRRDPVSTLRRHPLYRAARIDKTRLAGLAATLIHYLKGNWEEKLPVWQMIAMPLSTIDQRATALAAALKDLAAVADGVSMIGGGSLPGSTLPTRIVVIKGPARARGPDIVRQMAAKLRADPCPIVVRIESNALVLDPRTVPPSDDLAVIDVLKRTILP